METDVLTLSEEQKAGLARLGVVLCYLHGSVATGLAGKDSDVDIAVLFDRAPHDAVQATADVVAALHGFVKNREMDVAILNTASPLLAQSVAARGKLLYARTPDDDLLFQICAMHEYESSRHIARIGREVLASSHL